MFDVFINAFKVKEIRQKMVYILLLLLVFRLGSVIYLPGIDLAMVASQADSGLDNLFMLIAGGNFGTVFSMGISPYITASIIMQLLTVAIPRLEEMQKEGETGRQRINQITRYVSVVLAFLQGSATVYSMQNIFTHSHWFVYMTAVLTLVAGTMFIMWIAELITERKIGNGSSFIIFANILSGVPSSMMMLIGNMQGVSLGILKLAIIAVIFVLIMAFAVLVQAGERRIPIHYARNMPGRRFGRGSEQYIPLKVNIAGVMSIIFAVSLLQLPQTLNQFIPSAGLTKAAEFLSMSNPPGALLYVVLIFLFTFFYTSFAINPVEMAQNLKNSQGIIPGIRQGKPTSDFIQDSVTKLSWIGAVFYSVLAMIPVIMEWIFKVNVGFGGTTLLIVTGVALELVEQLEMQLVERHYEGFLGSNS